MKISFMPWAMLVPVGLCLYGTAYYASNEEDLRKTIVVVQELTNEKEKQIHKLETQLAHEQGKTEMLEKLTGTDVGVNNNPLNIKGLGWAGQVGVDKQGHARFSHPHWGLRAGGKTLMKYQKKHKIHTVKGVIERWAKGNTRKYTAYVADKLGVGANEEIDIVEQMPWLLKHMVRWECGEQPFPDTTYILLSLHTDL